MKVELIKKEERNKNITVVKRLRPSLLESASQKV